MSSHSDRVLLLSLPVDTECVGLQRPGPSKDSYFCTPRGVEYVGWLGSDGVHFILLPGDERVFCVNPSMGEPGTFVLPVAENMRQFLSYVLYCEDTNPLSQLFWMDDGAFRLLLDEDRKADWPGSEEYFACKRAVLCAIARAFALEPEDPYGPVKALQAAFDPSVLNFSDEYYETLGIGREKTKEVFCDEP